MLKIILIALLLMVSNCVFALPTPKKTTLSWVAPTTNVDGSPLTDLGGYKIYWSTTSGAYTDKDSKDVGVVLSTSIPVSTSGMYYFVVTAYDTDLNESSFSNEVSTKLFRGINPVILQIK